MQDDSFEWSEQIDTIAKWIAKDNGNITAFTKAQALRCLTSERMVQHLDVDEIAKTEILSLRSEIVNSAMKAGKLNSFGGATPGSLGDKNKAQQIAGTIDSVVNTIIKTSVLSSVQTAESIKGSISANSYLSALFIHQGGNVSVWDAFLYPPILTHLIRIQASYAAAMLNYISQNLDRMREQEMESTNAVVESMLNRLNSLA